MSEEKKEHMPTLPGNSYTNRQSSKKDKAPEQKKDLKKVVVTGEVIQKKKGFGSKIRETVAGDDAKSVASYIFFDVFIPAAKAMIVDAASQGTERLLYGGDRGRDRVAARRAGYTSYSKMYNNNRSDRDRDRRDISSRGRANHDFDEIILSDRGEAEEAIDQLMNLIDDYGHAKVSDLYEILGISGNYTDDKWGWTDLRGAATSRVREGYRLELPKPEPLK